MLQFVVANKDMLNDRFVSMGDIGDCNASVTQIVRSRILCCVLQSVCFVML